MGVLGFYAMFGMLQTFFHILMHDILIIEFPIGIPSFMAQFLYSLYIIMAFFLVVFVEGFTPMVYFMVSFIDTTLDLLDIPLDTKTIFDFTVLLVEINLDMLYIPVEITDIYDDVLDMYSNIYDNVLDVLNFLFSPIPVEDRFFNISGVDESYPKEDEDDDSYYDDGFQPKEDEDIFDDSSYDNADRSNIPGNIPSDNNDGKNDGNNDGKNIPENIPSDNNDGKNDGNNDGKNDGKNIPENIPSDNGRIDRPRDIDARNILPPGSIGRPKDIDDYSDYDYEIGPKEYDDYDDDDYGDYDHYEEVYYGYYDKEGNYHPYYEEVEYYEYYDYYDDEIGPKEYDDYDDDDYGDYDHYEEVYYGYYDKEGNYHPYYEEEYYDYYDDENIYNDDEDIEDIPDNYGDREYIQTVLLFSPCDDTKNITNSTTEDDEKPKQDINVLSDDVFSDEEIEFITEGVMLMLFGIFLGIFLDLFE